MSDDPKKRHADGKLVSTQKHEVDYLARKHDLPVGMVREVAVRLGPSRAAVERALSTAKRNGRK
jgi:hypothetical protein